MSFLTRCLFPPPLPFLLPLDCYRLHLLMFHQKIGPSGHSSRQQSVDVRVWPRDLRPQRVVGPGLLLPARLPRRRAPFRFRLGPRHQLHPAASREAAVQSDAVLLGRLRPRRWPFRACSPDHLLQRAAAPSLAAVFRQQRLAGYEPDGAFACPGGTQEPRVWLLGPVGHLLMRAANGHELQTCVLNTANRYRKWSFHQKKSLPHADCFFLASRLLKLSAFYRNLFLSRCSSFLLLCFEIHNFSPFFSFQIQLNSTYAQLCVAIKIVARHFLETEGLTTPPPPPQAESNTPFKQGKT